MFIRIILLLSCLIAALPAMSQVGHPAKGSWSGELGINAAESNRLRLLIKSEDGNLTGTINPGRRGIDANSIELNAPTWTLTIKVDMPEGELVMTGKLENLGSWSNRKYFGTYTLAGERGTFALTLN